MSREIVPLEDMVEAYWEQDNERYEREEGRYWASECWQCPAKVWFKNNPTEDEEIDLPHGVFERGNSAEDFICEKVLRPQYGDYLLREVPIGIPIGDDMLITGKADAVLVDRNLQVRRVWEIKSKGGRIYSYNSAKTHHECQLLHYVKALRPSEGGAVIYVNTSDYDDYAEINVSYTKERWHEIVRYWISVHEQFIDNEPVFKPKNSWECFFFRRKDKKLVRCDHYLRCVDHDGAGPADPIPDELYEKAKKVE